MNFELNEYQVDKWKVQTFENFWQHIESRWSDFDDLFLFLDKSGYLLDFRWPIEVSGVQYLLLVMPKDKKLFIYSKNLLYEKLLVEHRSDVWDFTQAVEETPLIQSPSFIFYNSTIKELPLFTEERFKEMPDKTTQIAKNIQKEAKNYSQSIFEKFSNFALDLTARYSLIRIHVLKFLAILPTLEHDKGEEIKRMFQESLRRIVEDSKTLEDKEDDKNLPLPAGYILAVRCLQGITKITPAPMLAFLIRKQVALLAQRFIAGRNIKEAASALESLKKSGRNYTLDQLGELVVSHAEADLYMNRVLELIDGIKSPTLNLNAAGVNEEHISIKVSALSNDFRPYAFESTYALVRPRLLKILLAAKAGNVFINVDAEHYHFRDVVFKIFKKILLTEPELKDFPHCGIVLQAYLKDSVDHLYEILDLARERKLPMPIRLVKGAYWDAETIETKAHNLESFQFLNKEETDLNFRQMCYLMLEESDHLRLAVASHNIMDHSFARALRELYFPKAPLIEHQCLHMTYEALSTALARIGAPTRNYIPVGDLLVGIAYLVRRIMENSSQVGILTIMRSHNEELKYNHLVSEVQDKIDNLNYVYSNSLYKFEKTFKNVYPIEVYKTLELKRTLKSLETAKTLELKKIPDTSIEEIEQSIGNLATQKDWGINISLRVETLLALANTLLIHREEMTGLIMKEAGKTLTESLADVDEAVDFIHFYVKESVSIYKSAPYEAKGVFSIIAPWNFPLAIPVGMTVAALATGNRAILKPSEKTPHIVARFGELAKSVGLDESILKIVYGAGEVGAALTNDDRVAGAVFTGSKAVGEQIYKNFKPRIGEKVPTVITEMGGKNAVIVTNNAELDETVSNLLYSVYAHAGQKCSACSRIIVDAKIKDAFLERFVKAANDLIIDESFNLATYVNPLIGKEEKELTLKRLKEAKDEIEEYGGTIHLDRSEESEHPSLLGPVILEVPAHRAKDKDSWAQKEFFAPIVHIIPYEDYDEAIEIFNSTDYALTGGIFTQSNDDFEFLMEHLEAGNIYINRSNTGARVAIEPFGGFKMSGTGPKAGSKEYLYSFINYHKVEPDDLYLSFTAYMKTMNFNFLNRQIPGQISFDSRKRPIGKGVFLIDSPLELRHKIEILMANLTGNEVSIYYTDVANLQKRNLDFFEKFAFNKVEIIEDFNEEHYPYFNFLVGNSEILKDHAKGFIDSSEGSSKRSLTSLTIKMSLIFICSSIL